MRAAERALCHHVKVVEFLPRARLDDGHRDFAAKDCGLDRSNGTAVFETGARALLWHRLGAFDRSMIGTMRFNPVAHCNCINALLGCGTRCWDVDSVNELWTRAIVDFHSGESTNGAGIDAKDLHAPASSQEIRSIVVGPV
jgi:hypothetical protein